MPAFTRIRVLIAVQSVAFAPGLVAQQGQPDTLRALRVPQVAATDEGAAALGWAPLREAPLPAQTREYRLWHSGVFAPLETVVRIVATGDTVRGEAAVWWSGDAAGRAKLGQWVDQYDGPRCERLPPVALAEACRFRQPLATGTWNDVLRTVDSLGANRLPGGPTGGLDGYTLVVEVRRGADYRAYEYWAPELTPGYAGTREAAQLAALVERLTGRERRKKP